MLVVEGFKVIWGSVGVFMAAFPAIASERPETEEWLKAIGPVNGLPPALQRALATEDFTPLPAPGPQDWLAVHPEPGQTFEEVQRSQPNRPGDKRPTISFQPLGTFPQNQRPLPQTSPQS